MYLEAETCKMLAKKDKLKVKVSKAVTKKKFKFKKRGALKDAELKELRRTHATNIFSWVSRDTEIRLEKLIQSEIETEIQMDCQDEHLERQTRLRRAEQRMISYKSRRVCQELVMNVLEEVAMYRQKEMAVNVMEDVVAEVVDRALVNKILRECQPRIKMHLLDRLKKEEERRRMLDKQRKQKEAWQERWRKLEEEISKELDALKEYEHLLEENDLNDSLEEIQMLKDDMEDMFMEMDEEDDQMMEVEEVDYLEWLSKELAEMGVSWDPVEESMMMEESLCEDPHCHGDVYTPVHDPPTLPEKGWEGVCVLGGHVTGERTPTKVSTPSDRMAEGASTPIGAPKIPSIVITQTPGLSSKLRGLEIEEEECLCSRLCTCDTIQTSVMSMGMRTPMNTKQDIRVINTPGLSVLLKNLEVEDEECLCSRVCECLCPGPAEREVDECICSNHCLEVGHVQNVMNVTNIQTDIVEGMKYCPDPWDWCLPKYTPQYYKPSTSRQYPDITIGKTSLTPSTESDNYIVNVQEMVEMENKDKVIVDMGVEDMIKVWEEMAREDMLTPPPSTQGGGGGSEAEPRIQEPCGYF